MNWDLLIGLVIGLSGSIIGLIGTIITNRQNKHLEIQKLIIENSFKEYEVRNELAIKIADQEGKSATIYPYDTYLIAYMELSKLFTKKNIKDEDITELLEKVSRITEQYNIHSKSKK